MEKIYDTTKVNMLLGCLLQSTDLISSEKYPLCKEDFVGHAFDKVIFVSIYNLHKSGYKTISFFDLDKYLQKHEAEYQIFKDCRDKGDVEDFLETIVYLSDTENYESYYNDVRKMSCIRDFRNSGYDVEKFWDYNKSDTENINNLEKYSMNDIISEYGVFQIDIEKKYLKADSLVEEVQAGYGWEDVKKSLQELPLYGHSFSSDLLNTVTRGMLDGSLNCFSSSTGVGKTTIAFGTVCNICAKEIWDYDTEQFIDNPKNTCEGALIIQFELDNMIECTSKLVAYISGVPTDIILDGEYTQDESDRIDRATEILKDSNIHLVYMPNFTTKMIDRTVSEYKKKYNIGILVFDYLQECSALNSEMSKANGGVGIRSDQVLTNLASFLKDSARKYKGLRVYTMSQTNANLGQTEIYGSESISGSRGTAHKFDVGCVFMPIRPKELAMLEQIQSTPKYREYVKSLSKFGIEDIQPTHVYSCYKLRFSKYPQNCKVWVNVSMGTGRMKDCFVTTWDNKLLLTANQGIKLEK